MRWLFLRSAHGGAERHELPPGPTLDPDSDMWTALFCEVVRQSRGTGLAVKVGDAWIGGSGNTVLARLPELTADAVLASGPDVIFNRGGYSEYRPVMEANRNAVTVYYGGGCRWMPETEHDIILVDTADQAGAVRLQWPNSVVCAFHKPAAPCFRPACVPPQFDIVFNCHREDLFKGHRWLIERIPRGCSVLRIGPPDPWWQAVAHGAETHVVFTGQIPRRDIPGWACRARVGVVCDDGTKDSGPRVLPEFLAMDIPVIVRDTVRADLAAYVVPETGIVVGDDEDEFRAALADLLESPGLRFPRKHYREHFALDQAATQIRQLVAAVRGSND